LGDEDGVTEWATHKLHQPGPNCAQAGWSCFAITSEFDHLFVQTDVLAPDFGATRRLVNNTFEDVPLTAAPFETFIDLWVEFVNEFVANKTDNFVSWLQQRERAMAAATAAASCASSVLP
jgi:hypothetical protein